MNSTVNNYGRTGQSFAMAFRGGHLRKYKHAFSMNAEKHTSGENVVREGKQVRCHVEARLAEPGNAEGTLVFDSKAGTTEPMTLRIGDAHELALYQAADNNARGLSVGEKAHFQAECVPWREDLVFTIPRSHEEIQRIEDESLGRPLEHADVVTLMNGQTAAVTSAQEETVTLDLNNPLAGANLAVEIEVAQISEDE